MLKFMSGIFLGAVMLGIVVHASRGQVATTEIKTKEIRQGDIFSMDVSVDRAPNLDGRIIVRVGPGEGIQLTMNCTLNHDTASCQTGNLVPLDAKLGKWEIKTITFQPSAQAIEKELTKSGTLSFQVIPHREVILPNAATVSDLK